MLNIVSLAKIFMYFFLASLLVLPFAADAPADVDLETILPSTSALTRIKPDGDPQKAEGKELYRLINGGAVTFLRYDFKKALFQEFVMDSGKVINLEIYLMGEAKDARGIYLEKKMEHGEKLLLDAEGIFSEYYCMFWSGPYYVTVTGEDSGEDVRNAVISIAKIVIDNIKS